ncbi:UNVERIFIED_CONTAM: hypothetical protein PYX00_003532 [Menopon gallinae]|uniref:3'-5' exonuclease domain-containing protein n=1 Tax=Menopon gallinae TaxID=328185 RepID=A0AAW2I0F3_9NEOP
MTMDPEFFDIDDYVLITLKDGSSFEGYVFEYCQEAQRICLKNVIKQPENTQIEGLRGFEGYEIKSIVHLETQKPSKGDEEDYSYSTNDAANEICEDGIDKIKELQSSFRYIYNTTSNFYSALSHLKECDIIGVHAKDVSRGRQCRATVIAVASETNIFIFDLATLGDKVFDLGLRDVLQSKTVKKVVHDARFLSDCLYHKHGVNLSNVRDVEAEDVMVVHQQRGCIRKHTRTLGYLIEVYLGGQSDVLSDQHLTDSWKKRPLEIEYQKYMAVFTSYLIPVHKAIEREYLQRLINASKIYNESVRDSDIDIYLTENPKYVMRQQLIDIVRYKAECRTNNKVNIAD